MSNGSHQARACVRSIEAVDPSDFAIALSFACGLLALFGYSVLPC